MVQQKALREIALLKKDLSQQQMDDILGTNILEPLTSSTPLPKRRKVRLIIVLAVISADM